MDTESVKSEFCASGQLQPPLVVVSVIESLDLEKNVAFMRESRLFTLRLNGYYL